MFIVSFKRIGHVMLLSFLICLLLTNSVSAEKQEWFNKTYDFSKVIRILITEPKIPDKLKNGITENEVLEIFHDKAKLPNRIKIISLSTLTETIKTDTGIDITILLREKTEDGKKLLHEILPKYVDLTISSRVFEYAMGSEYREGYTYNTTEYQTSYVRGYGGSATIQTPVTRYHTVPGGNVPVAYAAVRWDVYDTQSGKTVFSRLDDRAKANPTIFNNTKPKSLYGRITADFFDDLSEKLDKKNG